MADGLNYSVWRDEHNAILEGLKNKRFLMTFSGGKDSIVMLRLAEKAFRPGRFPFPLVHIDTEHNFPEVIVIKEFHGNFLISEIKSIDVNTTVMLHKVDNTGIITYL